MQQMQPRSQSRCHCDNIKNYDNLTLIAIADFIKSPNYYYGKKKLQNEVP
jgi:hypothetical protein